MQSVTGWHINNKGLHLNSTSTTIDGLQPFPREPRDKDMAAMAAMLVDLNNTY